MAIENVTYDHTFEEASGIWNNNDQELQIRIAEFEALGLQDVADGTFSIYNSDNTSKKLVFSVSPIASGITRTITMPNFDVDLSNLNQDVKDTASPIFISISLIDGTKDNIIIGELAMAARTTAYQSVAIGTEVLESCTTGYMNVGVGYQVLKSTITGATYNTAVGYQSMMSLLDEDQNTAIGAFTLWNSTTGKDNIAVGSHALYFGTTVSDYNTAVGSSALRVSDGGDGFNTAVGYYTLGSTTSGGKNSAFGRGALYGNTTGYENTAVGHQAGWYIANGSSPNQVSTTSVYIGADTKALASGDDNEIVIGYDVTGAGDNTVTIGNSSITLNVLQGALSLNDTYDNIIIGVDAFNAKTDGNKSIAIGYQALYNGTSGEGNVVLGYQALYNGGENGHNVAIGRSAGRYIANGSTANQLSSNSIYIGSNSKSNVSSTVNEIVIGYNAIGAGSNTVTIGDTNITNTYLQGDVIINGLTVNTAGTTSKIYFDTYNSTNSIASSIDLRKSANNTEGIKSPTADGEVLGSVNFYGVDPSNIPSQFSSGARIRAIQDMTPVLQYYVGSKLVFTVSNNGTLDVDVLELRKDGSALFAGNISMSDAFITGINAIWFTSSPSINKYNATKLKIYSSGDTALLMSGGELQDAYDWELRTTKNNFILYKGSNLLTVTSSGLTVGSGAAGVDYTLTFDGETNDGVITYYEDEDGFFTPSYLAVGDSTEFSGDSDKYKPVISAYKTDMDWWAAIQGRTDIGDSTFNGSYAPLAGFFELNLDWSTGTLEHPPKGLMVHTFVDMTGTADTNMAYFDSQKSVATGLGARIAAYTGNTNTLTVPRLVGVNGSVGFLDTVTTGDIDEGIAVLGEISTWNTNAVMNNAYSFYSYWTGSQEPTNMYHFYGDGDYRSWFGGNVAIGNETFRDAEAEPYRATFSVFGGQDNYAPAGIFINEIDDNTYLGTGNAYAISTFSLITMTSGEWDKEAVGSDNNVRSVLTGTTTYGSNAKLTANQNGVWCLSTVDETVPEVYSNKSILSAEAGCLETWTDAYGNWSGFNKWGAGDLTVTNYYSFYSNLDSSVHANTTIISGYHFYGEGNYPSYFGGTLEWGGGSAIADSDKVTTFDGSLLVPRWDNPDELMWRFMVDPVNGDDSYDGQTWATAKATIQGAVDALPQNMQGHGAFILTHSGTYGNVEVYKKGGSGFSYIDFQHMNTYYNSDSSDYAIWCRNGASNPIRDNNPAIIEDTTGDYPFMLHSASSDVGIWFNSKHPSINPWNNGFILAERWVLTTTSTPSRLLAAYGTNTSLWILNMKFDMKATTSFACEINTPCTIVTASFYGGTGDASTRRDTIWKGALLIGNSEYATQLFSHGGGYGDDDTYSLPQNSYLYVEDVNQIYAGGTFSADKLRFEPTSMYYADNVQSYGASQIRLRDSFAGYVKYDPDHFDLLDESTTGHIIYDSKNDVTNNYFAENVKSNDSNVLIGDTSIYNNDPTKVALTDNVSFAVRTGIIDLPMVWHYGEINDSNFSAGAVILTVNEARMCISSGEFNSDIVGGTNLIRSRLSGTATYGSSARMTPVQNQLYLENNLGETIPWVALSYNFTSAEPSTDHTITDLYGSLAGFNKWGNGTLDITNYYGFYSDLENVHANTTIISGWHFYGAGDYPSYFGGDITIGATTPDDVRPTLYMRGDARVEPGTDVTDIFSLTLVPAAAVEQSRWKFSASNSKQYGWEFDSNLLITYSRDDWHYTEIKNTNTSAGGMGGLQVASAHNSIWLIAGNDSTDWWGFGTGRTMLYAHSDELDIGTAAGAYDVTLVTNSVQRVIVQGDGSSVDFTVPIVNSTTAGITASTTQSQGQQPLTKDINEVSTVANTNDVVTMPSAVAGMKLVIINNGANTLQIFPASGDNLGAGVDTSTTLAAGSNVIYVAYNTTNWEQI